MGSLEVAVTYFDPKGHGDICGRFDLVYDPKGHGVRSGQHDLLYDPKVIKSWIL